jgi:hypothetical protein
MDRKHFIAKLRWLGPIAVALCIVWAGGANWPHP